MILADIYFNGAGVKRNVPLAFRFACEFDERAAEMAMGGMRTSDYSLHSQPLLEFCDYASTTFTMNFCNGYASEMEDDRRARFYDSLKSNMTPEQQSAFEKLLDAEKKYIDAHAAEVDQGGSIRVIRTIESQGILKDNFRAEVVHFEHKRWPGLSQKKIKTADALLRREYEKKLHELRNRPEDESYEGAVTAEQVATAQAAWESYRRAWMDFARLRYPAVVDAIRAEITLERCRLIRAVGGGF